MLPSTDTLLCFCEAARHLSFRAAARAVALTPAAVGQRIRQLEDQLGAQLFQRTTRQIVLTQAGLAFLPHARSALASAEQAMRAGRGETDPAPTELTVGTRHELGMSWLLPMLSPLQQAHPGVTLHLNFGSSADLLIRVRTLEVDCAIGSMRLLDPKLDAIRLHREEYVFVGQPHLLRKKPLRRAADAKNHTLIDTHPELPLFGYWRDAPGSNEPLEFGRILCMGTIAALRELALRGIGVAVLPAYLVAEDLRRGRLERVFPKSKLADDSFRLIFRADDARRSLFVALARTMLKVPLR